MKKTLWLSAALALTVAGCADMQTQTAEKKPTPVVSPELDAAIATAEKEIAAAKKSHHLWNNTEKFLDAAKKAKQAGKAEEAMKNAKKAIKEAQLAQQQAMAEANAKPHYPKLP